MRKKIKPIRVAVDIRDLRVAKTGQKTVTEELCKQFAVVNDPDIEFIFFDSRFSIYTGTKKWRIFIGHMRYQFWKQVTLPVKAWRNNCDIVFCADYFVPYIHLGFKTTEIFHDAFFFEYPEHYNRFWLKIFHSLAMPAARRCAYIFTTTHYAKKQLHALAGFPLEKLVPVYWGPKSLTETGTKQDAHSVAVTRKYVLHVGVMEKRKNLPALIRAFHQLTQRGHSDIDLVLVGQGNGKAFSDDSDMVNQTIKAYHLENRVICTGYLSDEKIADMYRNAFAYVFPSINEGFGIPILEAFRFHLPVLVANNSCLPEVGSDAVLTFDPYNDTDICDKLEEVINNNNLRNELICKGQERLQFFSWEKAAADIIKVFKQVGANGSS